MQTSKIISLIFLSLFLQNCAPLVIAGGGALVGETALEERTVGTQIDDMSIWGKVKSALSSKNKGYSNINVKVNEGRVLLVGTVDSPEQRLEVLKIVWKQQGVLEVINEIKIESNEELGLSTFAKDSLVTTQIKSKLLFAKNIRSMNYSIETINNVVYILGIAQDQDELDQVTELASKVKYVEKVVSYVRLKDSKIRKEMRKI
jgi:osmotically-inducible protein OsmY